MDEKCTIDPGRDCEVRQLVKQIERDLHDLSSRNAKTHERFGERIGDLEAHNKVQDVEVRNLGKSIDTMSGELKEIKVEAKEISKQLPVIASQVNAIHESHKAAIADVDELKGRPGKTWEEIKSKAIGWAVALVLAIIAAALGLSKFL